MSQVKYRRIILKVSDEALARPKGVGIDPAIISHLVKKIKSIHSLGVGIGVVCGGDNTWHGETGTKLGIERLQADYTGVLAIVMNGLASQDGLEYISVPIRIQTSVEMRQVTGPYIRRRAARHLEEGCAVTFSDGADNLYFLMNTTTALRVAETDADVILMARNGVDGAYLANLKIDPSAAKYDELTQLGVISKNLKVMDRTASSPSMDIDTSLVVFNVNTEGSIKKVIEGESIGIVIRGGKQ